MAFVVCLFIWPSSHINAFMIYTSRSEWVFYWVSLNWEGLSRPVDKWVHWASQSGLPTHHGQTDTLPISLNRLHLGDYAVSKCIMPFSYIEKGLGVRREDVGLPYKLSIPSIQGATFIVSVCNKRGDRYLQLLELLCTNNGHGKGHFRING